MDVSPTALWSYPVVDGAAGGAVAHTLGRLLYLLHLAILLWWLLDKSPAQRATSALVALLERAGPLVTLALRVPTVPGLVVAADALVRDALLTDPTLADPPHPG